MNDHLFEKISKDAVVKYESIRRSGKFNMLTEGSSVANIIWPDIDDRERWEMYSFLQHHFSDFKSIYNLDENYNYPKFSINSTVDYCFK